MGHWEEKQLAIQESRFRKENVRGTRATASKATSAPPGQISAAIACERLYAESQARAKARHADQSSADSALQRQTPSSPPNGTSPFCRLYADAEERQKKQKEKLREEEATRQKEREE